MNVQEQQRPPRPPDPAGVVTLQPRGRPTPLDHRPDEALTSPLPRQRGNGGHGFLDAVASVATAPFPSGHLCSLTAPEPPPAPADPAQDRRGFAWLLLIGGAIGLLVSVVRAAENAVVFDLVPPCGVGAGPVCEPAAASPWGHLVALIGIAGFAAVTAIGAIAAAGLTLSRQVGVGLLAAVSTGTVIAHWSLVQSLFFADALCAYCVAACLVAIPLFWSTLVTASTEAWLPLPAAARGLVEHHRWVVGCWSLAVLTIVFLTSDWYESDPVEGGAFGAVALISAATVFGAWLANRYSGRMGLWLSLASAMMLVSALTDIVPDVWHDSEEAGTPLWMPALALVAGFVVVAWFTRGGCGHGHDDEPASQEHGDHGPPTGRHRPVGADTSAALGGVGAAAALTVHRVIEGATLALTPSVPVIAALLVHSASEGLALAALFKQARQSMVPWLVIAVLGPVAGVIMASVSPLPETIVPILLALVAGVLLRTAMVGIGMARDKRRSGELRNWHIGAAVAAAIALGAITIVGH
ncbi:vitamin K epoxide reductase family protein [Actinomycetospora chibensis]|uniref:Vitamin K epoxide reductase family protein n=1 Tax=Actinomycetospora chibensis TaxID=663606 RepID=A0ABV9RL89_9PSEU|nr:vitamin K epoxide reductase family protein [Actinomycetospora chibensis]MDD7922779.1 vitamin K epoxide reductase family protein [Actinomycetospora chibensis]